MAKEVTNVERETVQPNPYALEKAQVTVECDDGTAYVFERVEDRPTNEFRLARREKPSGEVSTSKGRLPSAVKETLSTAVSGWHK